MMTETYKALREENPNRRRDCSVIAISIATGVSYLEAEELLTKHGRRKNRGAYMHTINAALAEAAGVKTDDLEHEYSPRKRKGGGMTMKTVGGEFPSGKYLVSVRGHIAAMIDGVVHDWSAGRRHRVLEVIKVPRGNV